MPPWTAERSAEVVPEVSFEVYQRVYSRIASEGGAKEVLTGISLDAAEMRRCQIWSSQRRCSGFMRTERRQVTVSERFVWSGHVAGGKRGRGRVVRARCRSNFAAAV